MELEEYNTPKNNVIKFVIVTVVTDYANEA